MPCIDINLDKCFLSYGNKIKDAVVLTSTFCVCNSEIAMSLRVDSNHEQIESGDRKIFA